MIKLQPGDNVLIVLLGAIGDVARGVAIAGDIKRTFPGVKVHWVVESRSLEVAKRCEHIDRLIIFNRKKWRQSVLTFLKELRAVNYAVTLDLQRHFKSGVISWLSAGRQRVGFHRKDAKEFNWIFNTHQILQLGEEIPKLDHYRAFSKLIGCDTSKPPHFGLKLAPPKFDVTNSVGFVLGSTWDSKDWFEECYVQLANLIIEQTSLKVALLGDPSKQQMASNIMKSCKNADKILNLVGKTSLAELVDLLPHFNVIIGPDSGPGHIAGSLGARHITIFGPTSESRTAPYDNDDLVVSVELGCRPCYRRECPGLNKLCMRLVTPEMIMQKVLTVSYGKSS